MGAYRYPGIKPFESTEKKQFFGRDEDINRLSKIINTEKLVVLYGKSGLGKSSLLNAGIIPRLEQDESNLVFKLRFGSFFEGTKIDPLKICTELIQKKLYGDKKLSEKNNIKNQKTYLNNFPNDKSTLWLEFKRAQYFYRNVTNFILIFDQFEELFGYPEEKQEKLAKEIADILYPLIPQSIREELEKKIQKNPNFITNEEKELLYRPLSIKIVIAIRSDRFSMLDKIREYIPDIFRQFYELLALNSEQAKEAILIPASLPTKENSFISKSFNFESEAINEMLNFLSKENTQEIETFQLQVLCFHLEKKVIEKKIDKIGKEQIENIGDIYKNFYDKLLEQLNPSEQKIVRNFIEEGLIFEEEERRLSLYEGQIYKNYHIKPKLLKWLVNTHIIRAESSVKGGFIYELSHDSLIKPILDSKHQYEKGKYTGLSKKEIEERKRLEKIIEERTREIESQKESALIQRDQIDSQNIELRKKNRRIMESVNYAKMIQEAMLPQQDYIHEILSEHFILNLPKLHVSGDFYWLKKIQNSIYIAVVDCAGHGIPGSMLSILGVNLLKDIFKNNPLLDVNMLLDELKKSFIHSLNTTIERYDGMQVSVCLIDKEKNQMQYAGANMPVYLIRNGELLQFKPDRQPIGIHDKGAMPFTKQTVQLEINDTIYLFTDGYYVQFGGNKGRKFLMKNFKSLLLSIQEKSMTEQKNILHKRFNEWKGDHDQVDDVLVFGIKYKTDS